MIVFTTTSKKCVLRSLGNMSLIVLKTEIMLYELCRLMIFWIYISYFLFSLSNEVHPNTTYLLNGLCELCRINSIWFIYRTCYVVSLTYLNEYVSKLKNLTRLIKWIVLKLFLNKLIDQMSLPKPGIPTQIFVAKL